MGRPVGQIPFGASHFLLKWQTRMIRSIRANGYYKLL